MKKTFSWIIKAAIAGIIALALLCLWCNFYFNVPIHYTNETGATEYKWQANKFFRKGTEGFAFGRTNNDGFNNLLDYEQGETIDILVMGSSHMEGMNVASDKNATAQLNQLFDGEKYAYNIGTSGHTLMYCLSNLADALDTYQPGEYVVIETRTVSFETEELQELVDGTIEPISSHTGGLVELMQHMTYLRLIYTKYLANTVKESGVATEVVVERPADMEMQKQLLNQAMAQAAESCREHSVQPIIVFDPIVYVDENGQSYTNTETEDLDNFKLACESNGIVFVDLTDSYLDGYNTMHKLPYGFTNTSPGMGHMNSWGHKLFAQDVYTTIKELEG